MIAAESSSGASGTGSRIPITANHSSPSQTRTPTSTSVRPRRSAASAPSTTVGSAAEAASRKRPSASSALVASRRSRSAATTRMPPVTASSTRSLRRTDVEMPVNPEASVTGPMRADGGARRFGQRRRVAEGGLTGGDPQQVGAEVVELGQQVGPAGGRDADHGDHRRDADGDAERGQAGPQPARAQPDRADPHEVARPQSGWTRVRRPGYPVTPHPRGRRRRRGRRAASPAGGPGPRCRGRG